MYTQAIRSSESGMRAAEQQMQQISNNIANMQTIAYKTSKLIFSEIINKPSGEDESAKINPNYSGVSITGISTNHESAGTQATGNKLDLAIVGKGFLVVENEKGDELFTRVGKLTVDTDGYLSTLTGERLAGNISISPDMVDIKFTSNGKVLVEYPDQSSFVEVGQLELAHFTNLDGLKLEGAGLYRKTNQAGEYYRANPTEEGFGSIAQGFLETSNVDMAVEMSELMIAQRGYQANARIISVVDNTQETLINLLR